MFERVTTAGTSTRAPLLKYAADGFLFLSFLYISLRGFFDYRRGGESWKQGDWLINSAAGPIRRGPFGSAIISISDWLNLDLLAFVIIIQIVLLALTFVTFRTLVASTRDPGIAILLIISPAIFTVFWAADPQGSVRKELIAFAGISLYSLGAIRANWMLLWLGVALFLVSTLSHEAMVLFVPTFFAIILISELHKTSRAHALTSIAVIVSFSIYALLFAIKNNGLEDFYPICAVLTERGLGESICEGAIMWLSYDAAFGFENVKSLLDVHNLAGFLIAYFAALVPLAFIIWISEIRVRRSVIAVVLLALPFLPLYPVAADWGRWMSFHVFSASIVLACAIAVDRSLPQRSPADYHLFPLLFLGVLISPFHMIGIIWGGVTGRVASDLMRVLS